jgi:hypothetical protein
MRWKRIAMLSVVFGGALAVGAWWRSDWTVTRMRVAIAPAAQATEYSPAECKRYCSAAFLPLSGVRASSPDAQVRAALMRVYGPSAAEFLMKERAHGRVLVGDGTVFFPTRELCEQKKLSGDCLELCRRYTDLH